MFGGVKSSIGVKSVAQGLNVGQTPPRIWPSVVFDDDVLIVTSSIQVSDMGPSG